jgi:galactose mutarotase-like enzyme
MKKSEVLQYIGNQAQIGGTRHYVLADGWGRDLRGIDVNSGSGLQYSILPDRGMDISLASYKGTNLVYLTTNGETHPAYFEPEGIGWLRTFTAGLLTTCGLTYLGAPVTDGTEQLGLHGRYSTIPAKQVADASAWEGDDYHIKITGIIEDAVLFGNKLRLEREIHTIQGKNSIRITDKVTNFGYAPSPYTILYHFNLGYPLLSENAELLLEPSKSEPRSEAAKSGLKDFKHIMPPTEGFKEQVFCHTMSADTNGKTSVTLKNQELGIALTIKFNIRQLPYLVQWKMMGQGEYVLGLEPSNVPLKNRKELREQNILPLLQPGESVTNDIEIILTDI